jgi:hemerythrin-like domain-containing protein
MWTEGASHMCNVHNTIFRGYNSIYQQAPHVKDIEKANFIGYCLTWYKFVHTHAMAEESGFFPVAEKLLGEEVFRETHKEHGNHPHSCNVPGVFTPLTGIRRFSPCHD